MATALASVSGGGPRWRRWLPAGLIALAALAAYHGSFSGPLVYDDLPAIAENPTIRHLSLAALAPPRGGLTVSGRPVLNLSLALNYAVSGTEVWSYHALNLLIHLLAGLALFGLVRRTLERRPAESAEARFPAGGIALAIALLWTVHPLQTEAVDYIVQRAESLMGLFYLLTLYCFVRHTDGAAEGGKTWAGLAVLCCLFGMGTKEVMVSAPVLALLYDRTFVAGSFREAWRRRRGLYAGLAATWLPLGALVAGAGGNRGGTAGFGLALGWWGYALTQFQAIAHYLRLSLWPAPLVFDYEPFRVTVGQVAPCALVVLAVAAATVWSLLCPARLGFGGRAFGFAGAWFFAILAPTSLVPSGVQAIAEHRMYLPLAAVLAVVVVGIYSALGRKTGFVLLVPAALGLAGATSRRTEAYRSNAALWAATVAQRPGNAFAQNNLGQALFLQGRVAEAETRYLRALELDPANAQAHYNLANILAGDGRMPRAIGEYREALRLRPNLFEAHNNLGLALVKAGRPEEAIAEFEATLRLQPGSFEAHGNLADVLAATGRLPESIEQYGEALRIEPGSAAVEENLGMALAQADRVPEAIAHFEAAVRINPGDPDLHYNLGMALGHVGREAEARRQFETADRLRAGNGVAPGRQ